MRLYELHLREVAEPYPPLAKLARKYADRYRALEKVLLPCLSRAFPNGRVVGKNFVIPVERPEALRRDTGQREPPRGAETRMVGFLRQWGARDIDPASNTLVWWDGRKLRIGRALTLIEELSRRADWREYEVARRRRWIEERERRGQPVPPDAGRLLDLPGRLPAVQELGEWRRSLERGARKGARTERAGGLVAVVSLDAVENAHRSTRRGWTSCYDPEQYRNPDYAWDVVECSLESADVMVWLTREHDAARLESPIGRTAMRVYAHGDLDSLTLVPMETYGSVPDWWTMWVSREFLPRVHQNCRSKYGKYRKFGHLVVGETDTDGDDTFLVLPDTAEELEQLVLRLAEGDGHDPTLSTMIRYWPDKALGRIRARDASEVVDFVRRVVRNPELRKALRRLARGTDDARHPLLALVTIIENPERIDPERVSPASARKILNSFAEIFRLAGYSPEVGRLVRTRANADVLDRAVNSLLFPWSSEWLSLVESNVARPSPEGALTALVRGELGLDVFRRGVPDLGAALENPKIVSMLHDVLGGRPGSGGTRVDLQGVVSLFREMEEEDVPVEAIQELLDSFLQRKDLLLYLHLSRAPGNRPPYVIEFAELLQKYGGHGGAYQQWVDLLTEDDPLEFLRRYPKIVSQSRLSPEWVVRYAKRIAKDATADEFAAIVGALLDHLASDSDLGRESLKELLRYAAERPDFLELVDRMLRTRNRDDVAYLLRATHDPRVLSSMGRMPGWQSIFEDSDLLTYVAGQLLEEGNIERLIELLLERRDHEKKLMEVSSAVDRMLSRPKDATQKRIADVVAEAIIGGKSDRAMELARTIPPDVLAGIVCGRVDTDAASRTISRVMEKSGYDHKWYVTTLLEKCGVGFDRLLTGEERLREATVRWIDWEYRRVRNIVDGARLAKAELLADALGSLSPRTLASLGSGLSGDALAGIAWALSKIGRCEALLRFLRAVPMDPEQMDRIVSALFAPRVPPTCVGNLLRTMVKTPGWEDLLDVVVRHFHEIRDPGLVRLLDELTAGTPAHGSGGAAELRRLLGRLPEAEGG